MKAGCVELPKRWMFLPTGDDQMACGPFPWIVADMMDDWRVLKVKLWQFDEANIVQPQSL